MDMELQADCVCSPLVNSFFKLSTCPGVKALIYRDSSCMHFSSLCRAFLMSLTVKKLNTRLTASHRVRYHVNREKADSRNRRCRSFSVARASVEISCTIISTTIVSSSGVGEIWLYILRRPTNFSIDSSKSASMSKLDIMPLDNYQ